MIKEYFVNYYQNNSQLEIRLKDQQVQVLKKNSEPWKVTMVELSDWKHLPRGVF